jgi:phosphoenolpyruvate-protein phosphotransferase (PTS system enzyme I)
VAGVEGASAQIRTGDRLIGDAVAGLVFVHPEASVEREYDRVEAELRCFASSPFVALDGAAITLRANGGKLADTEAALLYDADGIGLYRTEFAFSVRPRLPTEDEQYEQPEHDLATDGSAPPRARGLAQPVASAARHPAPLRHPDVLKPQLRAILRVSADDPASILLPAVAGVEEVR